MKRLSALSLFLSLVLTACSAAGAGATPTSDGNLVATSAYSTAFAILTQTAQAGSPTPSATASLTSVPPTVTATAYPIPAPVTGIARTPLTVRSEPRKGGDNLGGIFGNQSMQVIARNDSASWYYIQWDKSPSGGAWVTAAGVLLKGSELTQLPIAIYDSSHNVIVLPPLLWTVQGSPLPIPAPAAGAKTASITQLAKVRIGPGPGYSVMGNLDPGTVVTLTGRLYDNSWFEIGYPSGLGGMGWVSADLIKANDVLEGLQFFNLLATPISAEEAKGGGNSAPTPDPNSTQAPTSTPAPTPAGPPGVVYQGSQVNVHSGPASSFNVIGMLNAGDAVTVTGETINKLWYRILYPAGSTTYGWISTHYIRITGGNMTTLPFFDNQGTPLPTKK
jgi:uncharacterized protein YgiM (DUF1202 family)